MKRHLHFLHLALGLLPLAMTAQIPGSAISYLDGNKVNARILNAGALFFDEFAFPDTLRPLSYEVPKGDGTIASWCHSIWVGGHDNSSALHLAASTYRQYGIEFYSGAYRSTHNYPSGRGFRITELPETDGVTPIDNGKAMMVYDNGFTVYDPATNTSVVQSIPSTRTRLKAVLLSNGKTMLFGDNTYPNIQDVYLCDPANGYSPQVSLQLHHYHRHSAAVTLQNGKTLLAGVVGAELYDPSTNLSTIVPGMPIPVNGAGSILLNDGRVLVAGGASTFGNYSTGRIETQLFDPATNTWTQGPGMSTPRAFPLLVAQPNGRVLIIGGSLTGRFIDAFDPATNTISNAGQTPWPLKPCMGGMAANGEVLLSGVLAGDSACELMRFIPSSGTTIEEGFSRTLPFAFMTQAGNMMVMQADSSVIEYDPVRHEYTDLPMQKVWKVSKDQINQFLADRANNTVDWTRYPDIQTWPAMGDPSQGEDTHLAPFVDIDNDGLYRPLLDGDYPCIMGDQTIWWMYHDDGPHTETGGTPIGLQVAATAYVFDCDESPCPDSTLDYTSFFHYEIINKGAHTLTDAMLGAWIDYDLGMWHDDMVGTDTTRNLTYVFNGDNFDETLRGFGSNPPAFGMLFLGGNEVNHSIDYDNSFFGNGYPLQPEGFYNLMTARWADGSQLVNNGLTGYDPLSTGPFSNHIYPGHPGGCTPITGWNEISAGNAPGDRHMVASHGPFVFAPGQKTTLDYALVYAHDPSVDHLGNLCHLQASADNVRAFWDAAAKPCFNIALERAQPGAEALSFSIHPNPAGSSARITLSQPASGHSLRITELNGRVLQHIALPVGAQAQHLDLGGLANGVYLISLEGEAGAITQRLSVMR